uniref:SAM domain-containing protein n=1 Tax=Meloidogyne javanica TaxID=6303 RepID=A0A915M3X3_MELJA
MRNAHQENSLDIAVRTGRANLCRLLLMHCPELPVLSTSECCSTTPTHLTKSFSTPIYPLHIAARIGNEDCLKVLLENGFDTKYLGTEGTSLHIAAINGNKNVLKILLDNEVNLPSPSINVKNIEGLTVLELLNKQLTIFGSSNEKRIHERVRSWEECRNIILKYLSKEKREQIVEKQNNNGDKKNLIPNVHVVPVKKNHPPCTTSSNSPKQKQPIRISTKNDTSDNKTITNNNIHNHSQSKSDCPNSTSADCPYQPLPEEIANKLENNQQKNINGFNYQNLPKSSLLYDNAPLSAAGRRKWQHNCCHPPNGSSSNSPLPRAEMTELIDSNQQKIINWLKIQVELEEELAVRIGHLLINNGFDCFDFLKGSLNTKFMTELGIERKSQLRICRCLDDPSTQLICIPNAFMFDSIFDWLKALNLSELFSKFSKENITSIKDLINFKLNRNYLEKFGITKLGHIARIIRSIDMATTSNVDVTKEGVHNTTNSTSALLLPSDNKLKNNLLELNATTSLSTISSNTTNNSITSSRGISLSPSKGLDLTTLRVKLRKGCVRFSAHYLGSIEISNISDGSEECRQTMHSIKSDLRFEYPFISFVPRINELNPNLYGLDKDENEVLSTIERLNKIYSGNIGIQFMHLKSVEERNFFIKMFENSLNEFKINSEEKIERLKLLLKMKAFEQFLALKFPALKRYSGEGAETMAIFFHQLLEDCSQYGIQEFFWGGAHRGRLALQNVLFQYPTGQLFRKHSDFNYKTINDNNVHVSTLPNPSHLEATIATIYGKARARAQTLRIGDYGGQVVGEGIVWEALSMSQVPNFRIGGSIHLIVNNQLAFTADKNIGRSSIHCGNVALAIDCPLICVNAENILEVIKAAKIALKYRHIFRKEIFVELICYRRYGHNELDEPRFTQPKMYKAIDKQKCLVDCFKEELINDGIFTEEKANFVVKEYLNELNEILLNVNNGKIPPIIDHLRGNWKGFKQAPKCVTKWNTGLNKELLKLIGVASVNVPNDFVKEFFVDFLFIFKTNSPLSEAAVVGFEYGFAIENPKRLVIWEAQFGDFYNGAQVQIDTLVASKWFLQNGLILLLPHGFDGAGPDHSSAHIERFLSLTDSSESQLVPDGDNINMRIITPYRKPLVIITPKLLLRHSFSSSPIEDFVEGTSFQPVLFDKTIKENKNIKKVIICSGKHSLTLFNERSKREICDTAIVRLEEICPFPIVDLAKIFDIYSNAKSFIWSQEEPRNAGCWPFIQNRFKNAFGIELKYAGRAEQAWIATSITEVHEKEVLDILETTFS